MKGDEMELTSTMRYAHLGGKVVVVTGGSRGIGAATARAFAVNGADVAVVGRDEAALTAVAQEIGALGARAVSAPADCTLEAELDEAASAIVEELGVPDVVAAFAGGLGAPVPTTQETIDHWRQVVEANLTSTYLTIRAFLPAMVERGSGTVLTMSSSAARHAAHSNAAYAAAKGGIVALTRHLAGEHAHRGIRVNCLAPAATENEKMRAAMTGEQLQRLAAAFPLGRIGQPVDIAAAALFLASDAASWITGITLDVAGGQVMP
jgi:3-oxoacyl-[acyl-carrier protein] reductase